MATVEEGLISYLGAYPALAALVGTRLYLMQKPQQATLPCLTITRVSTPREMAHDTAGSGGTLAHPRFQFDAWATTYGAAKGVTDALRAALNGKSGAIGSGSSLMTIRAAMVEDEVPDLDPDTNIYRSQSDYIVWHEE